MAYVNTTTATTGLFGGFSKLASKLIEDMAKKRLYRITVKELSNLSDRELHDLAISRSEIHAVARKGAYGI